MRNYHVWHGFITYFNSYDLFNCSEFEELEAVPTMAVMDGPLEPPSASASVVSDMPDDPAFVNFFSVSTAVVHVCDVVFIFNFSLLQE